MKDLKGEYKVYEIDTYKGKIKIGDTLYLIYDYSYTSDEDGYEKQIYNPSVVHSIEIDVKGYDDWVILDKEGLVIRIDDIFKIVPKGE